MKSFKASVYRSALTAAVAGAGVCLAGLAWAQEGGRPIAVTMNTAQEVPSPGNLPGTGTAIFRINPGQNQVCYELTVEQLSSPVIAAHIHRAPAGVAGPIVVPLNAPTSGSSQACAEITRELAKELIQSPQDFYVNVHTTAHPPGEVRAQLDKTQGGPKIIQNPFTP
jgi:hypothetical protein